MAAAKLHPLNHLVNFVHTRYFVMNCDKCEKWQFYRVGECHLAESRESQGARG